MPQKLTTSSTEVVRRRREVWRGYRIRVETLDIECADGTTTDRDVVVAPNGVSVVAIDSEGRVILVNQWRHAAGRPLWELPSGALRPKDRPLRVARRELQEETGYRARDWRLLSVAFPSPANSSEELWIYCATQLIAGKPRLGKDERLVAQAFYPNEIERLVRRREIDLKTICGIALAPELETIDLRMQSLRRHVATSAQPERPGLT